MNRFTAVVSAFIERHGLLSRGGRHIVALSGGADSVALALVLRQLGYSIEAAHCNFHLRGSESDRDEDFVELFCREQHIALHRAHFNTREYAALHKVSIEMAARDLRYRYFEQLRRDIGAETVCVAHHREDSVETVLINLLRGTGIHGLTGISARNGHIVRPLLPAGRQDIEDYLAAAGQTFVTDSTNLVDDVTRNKIRLDIMPLLRQINPNAGKAIYDTALRLGEAAVIFDDAIDRRRAEICTQTDDGCIVDLGRLNAGPAPETTLFELLRPFGFNGDAVGSILATGRTGAVYASPGYDLAVDRGRLVIERRKALVKPLTAPEPGTYILGDSLKIKIEITDGPEISRDRNTATLDAGRIRFPLHIRRTTTADRFVPFGMKGEKLVSDYLTDRKKTVLEKRRQLVVCDAGGCIIWLAGERTDNRYRVNERTAGTLKITLVKD